MRVKINSYGVAFCPNCNGSVWQIKDESKYCFRCGEELDWEDKTIKTAAWNQSLEMLAILKRFYPNVEFWIEEDNPYNIIFHNDEKLDKDAHFIILIDLLQRGYKNGELSVLYKFKL